MTTIHRMGPDLTAMCGAESYDLGSRWESVTCLTCLALQNSDTERE